MMIDYDLIETFIVISEVKSLTKASELLYKTQPTISNRIQQLENILGFSLFIRQKGKQIVEITLRGKKFLPIAQQLFDLYNEIQVKEKDIINSLNISSIASYQNVAADICKLLVTKLGTHVSLYTYQTQDAYTLISQKKLDVAFVSCAKEVQSVVCDLVFSQNFYVAKQCDHPGSIQSINVDELEVENEILQNWNTEFLCWHNKYFHNKQPRIQIDSTAMLRDFMTNPLYWTIIQESSLYTLTRDMSVQLYTLTPQLPQRKCYVLTNRFPDKKIIPLLRKFKEMLNTYVINKGYFHGGISNYLD